MRAAEAGSWTGEHFPPQLLHFVAERKEGSGLPFCLLLNWVRRTSVQLSFRERGSK